MVTRNDVAKKASVSSATVSRVMSGYAHVSPEIRDRVLQAAESLNYHPHSAARTLRANRSKLIACLVPDITHAYYAEIFKGIHNEAKARGFHAVLEMVDFNGDQEIDRELAAHLMEQRIEGIIICGGIHKTLLELLAERFLTVDLQNDQGEDVEHYIHDDLHGATRQVVNYLFEQGHRKIGMLSRDAAESSARVQGYLEAMTALDLPVREQDMAVFERGSYLLTAGYETMKRWLADGFDATAVIANNDAVAIGAMKAVREKGLHVPGDVSFVGFDDTLMAAYSWPPLTTVKLLKQSKGTMAVNMLMDLIDGKKSPSVKLEVELIIRESVADRRFS